jgi:hypothetical protein
MWVNVIPLLSEEGDHAEIHVQASLLFSDQEVQNAAQFMLNLSGLNLSYFLNEGSDEIRRANFTEANKARYEDQSERMKGNQRGAGSHDYPSGRQSRGPGSYGYSFEFGNRHSVVHGDAAILADFVELKCAEISWWTKWSGANDGDILMMNGSRTLVKSSGNKMRATRFVVGIGRTKAKKIAINAAKEAAGRKQWSSFRFYE